MYTVSQKTRQSALVITLANVHQFFSILSLLGYCLCICGRDFNLTSTA